MQKRQYIEAHPMVIFWLGVLTGAIVVGLVFFYKILSPTDLESSLLRFYYSPYKYSTLDTQYKYSALDTQQIGTPEVDYNFIGNPDGN